MRNVFKNGIDFRREQNRRIKFGKWGSLLIKIALVLFIANIIKDFNSDSAKSMLWFMSGGNDKYLEDNSFSNK